MLARFGWLILTVVALHAQPAKYTPPAPAQPIPYSHRAHLALGLECKGCHPIPDPGDFATIPETAKCMSCHRTIKKDSAAIRILAEAHEQNKAIEWKRVYRLPDYVFFSHKEHVDKAGVACETCHGPVRERDVMRREKEVSMAACMDCHRARQAPVACNSCHDQR